VAGAPAAANRNALQLGRGEPAPRRSVYVYAASRMRRSAERSCQYAPLPSLRVRYAGMSGIDARR